MALPRPDAPWCASLRRRMLRWGFLGPGTAGQAAAPAMRAVAHDLAVVAAPALTDAQRFAAGQGVRRARAAFAEVLDARDVDAVYVGVPTHLREQWAVAALDAGKHVLCERPLAPDADAAARVAAAAARSGGHVLMEALPTRFHPRTVALLELVRSGGVGAVRLVSATYAHPLTDADSFRARPEQGGGALLDVGVDLVAVVRWLLAEEPEVVRAVQRRWATGVDGTTSAVLSFPSGAQAAVHASLDGVRHEALELVGTEGTIRVPRPFTAGADAAVSLLRGDDVVGTWRADPWERLLESFEAACGGTAAPLGPEDAVAGAHVLDWIRAAAE